MSGEAARSPDPETTHRVAQMTGEGPEKGTRQVKRRVMSPDRPAERTHGGPEYREAPCRRVAVRTNLYRHFLGQVKATPPASQTPRPGRCPGRAPGARGRGHRRMSPGGGVAWAADVQAWHSGKKSELRYKFGTLSIWMGWM